MNTNRVVARSTTLLPNIPGLASILTLLFAPRAEFRTNATRTRLTGAICGLGFDKERNCQSFYPEHDMEIAFDTEIDLNVSSYEFLFTLEVLIIVCFFSSKDVLLINKSRFWFNSVLGPTSYSSGGSSAPSRDRMREVSQKLLQMLFDLITKHRNDVEVVSFPSSKSSQWNLVPPNDVLQSGTSVNQIDELFALHDGIKLVP